MMHDDDTRPIMASRWWRNALGAISLSLLQDTDKCQEVVILMKIYGTFCNLFYKLSRKKAES